MKRKRLNEVIECVFMIDMNNGFCERGLLADPFIKRIVPSIIEILRDILKRGEALFVVNDAHTKESVELKRFLEHDLKGTWESKTIKELEIYEEYATKLFYKNSNCALFAHGVVDTLLKMTNLKRVILVGCCTDICIQNFALALRNLFDELNLDIDIIVPLNAVETYHIDNIHDRCEYNELGCKVMKNNGIKLVRTYGEEKYNEK